MRFSGSLYDNLRQPGVFQHLEEMSDSTEERMRHAVLARLRFDDLLSHEEAATRVVVSFSDVLDGRLFTLLDGGLLQGVELEVCCPRLIAGDHASAVVRTLRAWIQNDDGAGRPAFFMAAPEPGPHDPSRVQLADAIAQKEGLDIKTLADAKQVLLEAGLSEDHADRLYEHWLRWDSAIQGRKVTLQAFHGPPASAAQFLHTFLRRSEPDMAAVGIHDYGRELLHRTVQCLEENDGRRDAPLRLLDRELPTLNGDEAEEGRAVKQVFFHYSFVAIAESNMAHAEVSAMAGPSDVYALGPDSLARIESVPAASEHTVALDDRIVSALGALTPDEYDKLKLRFRSTITVGLQYAMPPHPDPTKLHQVFEALAKEVKTGHYIVHKGIEDASRTWLLPIGGPMGGAALGLVFGPIGVVVGAGVGAAATATGGILADKASRSLLRKSLVRTALGEIESRRRVS